MHAPDFWQHRGPAALLLSPLGALYGLAGKARRCLSSSEDPGVPVICVGNLTAGGAGKTPLVLSLARRLTGMSRTPHILSRGYGGRLKGPVQVEPDRHDAYDAGDEPLLLARVAPTWIGADRAASASRAVEAGADVLLMDDGFQNPGLKKTLSILAIDGGYGFGNGFVIPAGPLREPIDTGLSRADAAVVIGEDRTGTLSRIGNRVPTFGARIVPTPAPEIAGQRVFAFAGIGRPAKFFESLAEIGCTLTGVRSFPDHHFYTPDEIMQLCDAAQAAESVPVTTEKDLVRFPAEAQDMVRALDIALEWAETDAIDTLIGKALDNG